jgi:hypothetical protein
MPKYYVEYTIMGGGSLEIEAANEEEADELAFDTSTEDLLENADFKGGFSVDSIEEIKDE